MHARTPFPTVKINKDSAFVKKGVVVEEKLNLFPIQRPLPSKFGQELTASASFLTAALDEDTYDLADVEGYFAVFGVRRCRDVDESVLE